MSSPCATRDVKDALRTRVDLDAIRNRSKHDHHYVELSVQRSSETRHRSVNSEVLLGLSSMASSGELAHVVHHFIDAAYTSFDSTDRTDLSLFSSFHRCLNGICTCTYPTHLNHPAIYLSRLSFLTASALQLFIIPIHNHKSPSPLRFAFPLSHLIISPFSCAIYHL